MAGPFRKVTSCSLTADESERIVTLTQREGLDNSINRVLLKKNSSKCLGVEIVEFLTWDSHITSVSKKKVSSGIGVLKKIRPFVPVSNLTNLTSVYQSIVEPYFDYCSIYLYGMTLSVRGTDELQSCKIVLHL